eukprot:8373360-Pyramimonas_sp.AAC.1
MDASAPDAYTFRYLIVHLAAAVGWYTVDGGDGAIGGGAHAAASAESASATAEELRGVLDQTVTSMSFMAAMLAHGAG